MFKQYLQVTKPGIIFGNLISVIGGFLLASKGSIDYTLFIYTLVGVSLVVASGCVFNNYIDMDIDKKMERTKNRVLVKGLIAPSVSLVYNGLQDRFAVRCVDPVRIAVLSQRHTDNYTSWRQNSEAALRVSIHDASCHKSAPGLPGPR